MSMIVENSEVDHMDNPVSYEFLWKEMLKFSEYSLLVLSKAAVI